MNKILNYILIFFLFALLSCDYKPILSKKKNNQFSIYVSKISGEEKINSIIINNFKNFQNNKKEYHLNLSSNKEKNIVSKDSKGDPSVFELIIDVNYKVKKDGEILIEDKVIRKTTYNNISDKFELDSYENIIINNLSTINISPSFLTL